MSSGRNEIYTTHPGHLRMCLMLPWNLRELCTPFPSGYANTYFHTFLPSLEITVTSLGMTLPHYVFETPKNRQSTIYHRLEFPLLADLLNTTNNNTVLIYDNRAFLYNRLFNMTELDME